MAHHLADHAAHGPEDGPEPGPEHGPGPGHGPGHHDHGHGPGHVHAPASFGTAFAIGAALNAAFALLQALYGWLADSVALMADALHNAGDVLGLLLAWAAWWMARWRPTARHTYGWGRSSILAAFANAVVLLLGCGAIAVEAVQRLASPGAPAGMAIMVVAATGIVVNGASALLFLRGRDRDLNVHAAFLHLVSDALVSAGVVVAGALVLWTGWSWVDPVASLLIVVVIAWSTWSLLLASVDLAMDAVPRGVDGAGILRALGELPGVSEVHDLHIWALSTTQSALTAHLVAAAPAPDLAAEACAMLRARFGIGHATVQIERPEVAARCALRAPEVV